MNDIETFVKLKYRFFTHEEMNYIFLSEIESNYPVDACRSVNSRWKDIPGCKFIVMGVHKFLDSTNLNNKEIWETYSQILLEELCKYELNNGSNKSLCDDSLMVSN